MSRYVWSDESEKVILKNYHRPRFVVGWWILPSLVVSLGFWGWLGWLLFIR